MLASEVEYVWHVKWGIGKVLYLLSRYPLLILSVMGLHSTLFRIFRACLLQERVDLLALGISGHVVSAAECRGLYSISGCASRHAMINIWLTTGTP